MTALFISYAREDTALIATWRAALDVVGVTSVGDWQLPPGVRYESALREMIRSTEDFAFGISPSSVKSSPCLDELAFAVSLNKRLSPIVLQRVPDEDVPPALRSLQWIFADRDGSTLLAASAALQKERLEIDRDWVEAHTRLLTRANEWRERGRDTSYCLRRNDLGDSEAWLVRADNDGRAPLPTAEQREFVLASQNAQRSQTRKTIGVLSVLLTLALCAALVAWRQSVVAAEQRRSAESREHAVRSSMVRAIDRDPVRSLLLAIESGSTANTEQARAVLYEALQTASPRAILLGHTGAALSAAFSPDDRTIVTASEDGSARLWNAVDGRARATLWHRSPGMAGRVLDADFSPDGRLVATASYDRSVRLWDVDFGAQRAELPHESEVTRVVFSPDGERVLSASSDGTARLWNVASASLVRIWQHEDAVWAIAFSPNGQFAVTAAIDGKAKLWEVTSGALKATLNHGPLTHIVAARFSPSGQSLVTAAREGEAYVWNMPSGRLACALTGHSGDINDAVFSPDGSRLATASSDSTVRLWNAKTCQPASPVEQPILTGHAGPVYSIRFTPDGLSLLSSAGDGTARLWNLRQPATPLILMGHDRNLGRSAVSHDGRSIATVSRNGVAQVWSGSMPLPGRPLEGHRTVVRSVRISEDGRWVVTAGADQTLRLWDMRGHEYPRVFKGHAKEVRDASVYPDGSSLLSASSDGTVRRWNITTGASETIVTLPVDAERARLIAGSQALITTSSDDIARLWRMNGAATFDRSWQLSKGTSDAFAVHDRIVAVGLIDRSIVVWDATASRKLQTLKGHTGAIEVLVFNKDATLIGSIAEDHTARVWRVSTGSELCEFKEDKIGPESMAFDPNDGRVVVGESGGSARVMDIETCRQGLVLKGHESLVTRVAFSPDGGTIVTGGFDGTLKLWNSRTGQAGPLLRISYEGVGETTFSSDGTSVATSSFSRRSPGIAVLIPMTLAGLLDEARRRLPVNLTADQQARLLLQ